MSVVALRGDRASISHSISAEIVSLFGRAAGSSVQRLEPSDRRISQMVALQDRVLKNPALAENIVRRDADYLRERMKDGDVVFGVVGPDDSLQGMAILHERDDYAVIGTLVVDPAQGGKGLMKELVLNCVNSAALDGVRTVKACVLESNDKCERNFARLGFQKAAEGISLDKPATDAGLPRKIHQMVRSL